MHIPRVADVIIPEFVKCQMTKLKDLECSSSYFTLKFVEFLEFMCRLAIVYAKSQKVHHG